MSSVRENLRLKKLTADYEWLPDRHQKDFRIELGITLAYHSF